jgi:hypothetical protein
MSLRTHGTNGRNSVDVPFVVEDLPSSLNGTRFCCCFPRRRSPSFVRRFFNIRLGCRGGGGGGDDDDKNNVLVEVVVVDPAVVVDNGRVFINASTNED